MTTVEIIRLARKHVGDNPEMESSARVALQDAVVLYDQGDLASARRRAQDSLMFSVGVFSDVFSSTL